MVRYLFYTIGDLTYQSPLVCVHLELARVYLGGTGGSGAHSRYTLAEKFLLPKHHVYLISFSGTGKSSQIFGS